MDTVFAIMANSLICLLLVPQMIRLARKKKARNLSLVLLILILSVTLCWCVFGWLDQQRLIFGYSVMNILLTVLTLILFVNSPYHLQTPYRTYSRKWGYFLYMMGWRR
jgi:uncharacterized protein with PQ loop repeat